MIYSLRYKTEQLPSSVYSAWDVYHGHETTKRSHMRRTLVPAYLLMQMNVHVCKPGEILYKNKNMVTHIEMEEVYAIPLLV